MDDFQKINFESVKNHKEKFKILKEELKYLKIGKFYPDYFLKIVEDLAIVSGICSFPQSKKAKKFSSREEKLLKIVNSFTIGKIKNMKILVSDNFLFLAFFIVVDPIVKNNQKFVSSYDQMACFVSNPGLAVKTIRKIPKLIQDLKLDKGNFYSEIVLKSFNAFGKAKNYSPDEGINGLVELLEELYGLFSVLDENYRPKRITYNKLYEISEKPLSVIKKPKKNGQNTIKFLNIEAAIEKDSKKLSKSINISPKTVSKTPDIKIDTERSEIFEENNLKAEQKVQKPTEHRAVYSKDYQEYKISKETLLQKFLSKNPKKAEVGLSERKNLEKTESSDNEDNKRPCLKPLEENRFEKMLHESRFFKKIDDLIEQFFKAKVNIEPVELEKYRKNKDYSWKKLDYIKSNTTKWVNECFLFLTESGILQSSNFCLKQIKYNAILNKLMKPNYIDTILFRFQSEKEQEEIENFY